MSGARGGNSEAASEARREQAGCELWAVLNVTPDSFSDGGRFLEPAAALAHAERLLAEGAAVIDVGGESSRPAGQTYGAGASEVPPEEELRRLLPVVSVLAKRGVRVSVDTVKAAVAERVLGEGARVINDVSCGRDRALLSAVARAGAELVLMHNRGRGERQGPNVIYGDLVGEVLGELRAALARAVEAGVPAERVWFDPGLGFAKTARQSLALLGRTAELVASGQRVLVGASRKSFLGEVAPDPDGSVPGPGEREGAHAAALGYAVMAGCHAVRVHDVRKARQALLFGEALRHGVAA